MGHNLRNKGVKGVSFQPPFPTLILSIVLAVLLFEKRGSNCRIKEDTRIQHQSLAKRKVSLREFAHIHSTLPRPFHFIILVYGL